MDICVGIHGDMYVYEVRTENKHTGGFSSSSSPLVGFALKFANTPSFCPPPYIRPAAPAVTVLNSGNCVTLLCLPGLAGLNELSSTCGVSSGVPRISRWRSSVSSSSDSASNVSASVPSASLASGSSASSRRDVAAGEEARLWKEGGGEAGMG